MQQDHIFALDIGTRSVVGIIAAKAAESEELEILDVEMLEHPERSMIGGQIHDIPRVAETVFRIKRTFENKHNLELKKVAVAAAGRSLLTSYGRAELSFPIPQSISAEISYGLQLEAVQSAQRQMGQMLKADDYHCVGYSILHQYLDEHLIGNLVGQSGKQAAVEVIASFLPRIVIDSLSAVLQEAGLEMAYLTLEPIAAMNMAVPESMRRLNLALVDIGAGTSDIAVSNGGTVTGYAMVPMAGDQITEALSNKYLLDFPAAEELKRQLEKPVEYLTFRDIMGFEYRHQKVDLIAGLEEIINDLAGKIAEAIIKLNGHPPQAVLCIGGGSLTPNLTNKIAACLDLPENRVAVTGYEQAAELIKTFNKLMPPQAITPLGIVKDALFNRVLKLITVKVNDRTVRLFQGQDSSVGDALIHAGINPNQYFGKIGPALAVEVNGETKFLKGQPGKQGKITVNGRKARLTSPVREGDQIKFVPGSDGIPGQGTVADVLPADSLEQPILVNGNQHPLIHSITVDGKPADPHTELNEGSIIQYKALHTISDLLNHLKFQLQDQLEIILNGTPVSDQRTPLTPGDCLEIRKKMPVPINTESINITFNGRKLSIPRPSQGDLILSDIFGVVDFDTRQSKEHQLVMKINNEKSGFTSVVKEGDSVEIYWKKSSDR